MLKLLIKLSYLIFVSSEKSILKKVIDHQEAQGYQLLINKVYQKQTNIWQVTRYQT